eukprot:EG_transcript_450
MSSVTVQKLELPLTDSEFLGTGSQPAQDTCGRFLCCSPWNGLKFRSWVLLLVATPLLILTVISFILSTASVVNSDGAFLLTKGMAAWLAEEVNNTILTSMRATGWASNISINPAICDNIPFIMKLAAVGPHVLVAVDGSGNVMEVVYRLSTLQVFIQVGANLTVCSFKPASFDVWVRVAGPVAAAALPAVAQPGTPVAGQPPCVANATHINCLKEGRVNNVSLTFPIASVTDALPPRLKGNFVTIVVWDSVGAVAVVSPCGVGLSAAAVVECLDYGVPSQAVDTIENHYAVSAVPLGGPMSGLALVSVPLETFTSRVQNLGPGIAAAALLGLSTVAAAAFAHYCVRLPLRELRLGLDEVNAVLTIELCGRGFLKPPRVISELMHLTLAYNRALKHILSFKSYVPAAVSPRSTGGSVFRSRSGSISNFAFGAPPRIRGRPKASGGPGRRRQDVPEDDGDGSMRDLADLMEGTTPPGQLPESQEPDIDEDGQNMGPPPVLSLEGVPNEMSRRMGSILVVELWYRDQPFGNLNMDLASQHGICEAFLQVVTDSLQKTRGMMINYDISRVVACWNAYAPQASHEYWACNAALLIQQRFGTAMQPFIRPMAEFGLAKSDLFVFMAVVRGSMNVGFMGTGTQRAPIVYGESLLMAERLTSLNCHCNTFILMPQRTFEAVQGCFTAEIVDYVLSPHKEETIAVYQLLGSEIENSQAYIDHYKDAFITFTRHRFDEALGKLELCEEMLADDRGNWALLRRQQCARLRELIIACRTMSTPNPYYRTFSEGWETFRSLSWPPDKLNPLTPPHAPGDLAASLESKPFDVRAGMSVVTADVLTGILTKEATQRENDAKWSRQVNEIKTQSTVVQGLKRQTRKAAEIRGDDGPDAAPPRKQSMFPMHMVGLDRNESNVSQLVDSPRDPDALKSCIEGQSFRDISGRTWRCSTQCLGRGGFGSVYLGIDEQGKLVAIKELIVKTDAETIRNQLTLNEIVILWNLQHMNIVSYQGCAVVRNSLAIIMEYIPCGTLESIIHTFGNIAEGTAVHYARDIVRGLDFLHSNGVVHLDVKPANVLLDQQGTCKLADFGTASALGNLMESEVTGTPAYMAPERVMNTTSTLSDIWSLGITLAEVLTGKKPFDKECTAESMLYGLYTKTIHPIIPANLSMHAISFLKQCLSWDPTGRSPAADLLHHPFLL